MRLRDISETSLFEDLRDPRFAAIFLEQVLQDGSSEEFLTAVRFVAQANGGVTRLAKAARLGRESMYKTLSRNGNPQFRTVQAILEPLGLRLTVVAKQRGPATKAAPGRRRTSKGSSGRRARSSPVRSRVAGTGGG